MLEAGEGERATLWVFGAMHDLVKAGLIDGPTFLTAKGCAAYDQIDAARHKLDLDLVKDRIAWHISKVNGTESDNTELAAMMDLIVSYLRMDRDLFHMVYKPSDDEEPSP
jgi:hypothetical protein